MKKQLTILLILTFVLGLFSFIFFVSYSYADCPILTDENRFIGDPANRLLNITDECQYPRITSISPMVVRIGQNFEIIGENLENTSFITSYIAGKRIDLTFRHEASDAVGGWTSVCYAEIISWTNSIISANLVCEEEDIGESYSVRFSFLDKNLVSSVAASPFFTVKEECAWTCDDYSACSESNTQTRTCTKPDDCQFFNEPMPSTELSCTYIPPVPSCTSDNWSCNDWSDCSILYHKQNRTCDKISNCEGGIPRPATSQSCTYIPKCASYNWSCGSWSECSSNGTKARDCDKTLNCEGGVSSPSMSESCTYTPPCDKDIWACGSWDSCSISGIQNRSCTKTFDCPDVQTAPPITNQYCEAPNRPQQSPPSASDEILNQDTIIKSTVKLLCPVDSYRASQGSGTVIDSAGTILTNKHVIAGTLGCLVGFIDGFNDEPYFGDRQIADITKISSTQDIAILKMRNPKNTRLSYVDVTKGSVNFSLGTKIMTYGYPAKFGTKITYTSGDFSGTDGSYLKTTAILEYGNSGGGAYLKNGTFIGIPSAVVKGELNAMGYLLSIDVIKAWLNNSTLASGNTNNDYSRVSVLEDIDLNKLDSLELFIPDVDEKGNLSASTKNQSSQDTKEQPQPNQTQENPTIIDPDDSNNETNSEQNSSMSLEQDEENKEEKENSEQRKSIVNNAVQEIVKIAERNGEIGQEMGVTIQTQIQNQEKLETGIQKIQSRGSFAKFFIGPNHSEIKNSQKILEENKEQIQKLNEIRTQIIDQGEQLQIIEQIQTLEEVYQQIETLLDEAQKGFSLLGWVFRLFSN